MNLIIRDFVRVLNCSQSGALNTKKQKRQAIKKKSEKQRNLGTDKIQRSKGTKKTELHISDIQRNKENYV